MKKYPISQVLQTTDIHFRILLDSLHKSSANLSILYRKFMNRCNSLFIIFAQFEVLGPAFEVIYKCLTADLNVFFHSQNLEKSWKGRILLYCNMAYMMYLIGDCPSSLKFLYDAESLLKESMEIFTTECRDLVLAHASLSFLVMFKARRYETAEKYVEIASEEFNSIIRGDRTSKVSLSGCSNLYCLVTLFLEVLKAQGTGLITTTNSISVYEKMKNKTKKTRTQVAALQLLKQFNSNRSVEHGSELINSYEFHSILFAVVFFPFIVKTTPVMQMHELTKAQEFSRSNRLTKAMVAQIVGMPHRSIEKKDMYAILMMESLQHTYK